MPALDSDYLKRRAEQLDLGRNDIIERIQDYLGKLYPDKVRVVSLNHGVLKINTSSASVASDLRLKQTKIMAQAADEIKRLQILITTLN